MTARDRPKLVAVAPHYPMPSAPHAGSVLLDARLRQLSEHYEVTCIVPDTPENRAAAPTAQGDAFTVVVTAADRAPSSLRTVRLLWPALRGDLDVFAPRLWSAVHRRAELGSLLADATVVEVHWGEYAALLPGLRRQAPSAVIGLFLHDVLTHARRARARTKRVRARERLVYALSARAAGRQEIALCNHADVVWVLKQADADDLADRGVRAALRTAQPWVDRQHLPMPSDSAPPTATFVAAFWRTENANAAGWLLEQVWPSVRRAVPTAELRLVGARPPAWLVDLAAAAPGATVTGYTSDLTAEYRRASVCLAPLTDPSGLKVKVLQAMVYGRAVVARPAAVAGIPDAPADVLGGVSDAPLVFAEHVSALLADASLADDVGRRAARWVRGALRLRRGRGARGCAVQRAARASGRAGDPGRRPAELTRGQTSCQRDRRPCRPVTRP